MEKPEKNKWDSSHLWEEGLDYLKSIINKAPNPGGPCGAMWLGLSRPHYGIHGTDNPASIGKNVSKGCIRMHNNHVLELSKLVPIGTKVVISA